MIALLQRHNQKKIYFLFPVTYEDKLLLIDTCILYVYTYIFNYFHINMVYSCGHAYSNFTERHWIYLICITDLNHIRNSGRTLSILIGLYH